MTGELYEGPGLPLFGCGFCQDIWRVKRMVLAATVGHWAPRQKSVRSLRTLDKMKKVTESGHFSCTI